MYFATVRFFSMTGRWRGYEYDELLQRDKLSLDLFWIKDESLTDTDSLPAPHLIAAEIVDDLAEALEQFTKIANRLLSVEARTTEGELRLTKVN
jgi:hypothetical protein